MVILFLLILAVVAIKTHATVGPSPVLGTTCGAQCLFRLCRPDSITTILPQGSPIILGAPGNAEYPFICRDFSSTTLLSTIVKTGEALVEENTYPAQITGQSRPGLIPISNWVPRGLQERFQSNFFQVANIPLSRQALKPVQGISRTSREETQDAVLHNQCIILPILSYDFADRDLKKFFRIDTVAEEDCVSFIVKTFDLIVDLTWNQAQNLDLNVVGPKGQTGTSVNRGRGVIITKASQKRCIGGKESVVFKLALAGRYTVVVTNPASRGTPPRTSRISTAVNGITILSRQLDFPDCASGDPAGLRMLRRLPRRITRKLKADLTVTFNGKVIFSKKIQVGKLDIRPQTKRFRIKL